MCSVVSDCDSMDCGPPGSSANGILKARILEWVAISFSRTVCCDPHSQRHLRSQWRRSRCFSGIPFFSYDPKDVGNLISGSSAFPKSSLYIWKFSAHILLKPSLQDFEHYFVSMGNEYNCMSVEHSLALLFFGIGIKTDLFQSCGVGNMLCTSLYY